MSREILFNSLPLEWGPFFYSALLSSGIALLGYQVYKRSIHNVMDGL